MPQPTILPADEDCDYSGLPKAFCSHCTGDVLGDEEMIGEELVEYVLKGWPFDAQFHGRCAIDDEHPVKRGTKVSRIQRKDNPMLVVAGVACTACMRILDRA